jgi:hypothetical protein
VRLRIPQRKTTPVLDLCIISESYRPQITGVSVLITSVCAGLLAQHDPSLGIAIVCAVKVMILLERHREH